MTVPIQPGFVPPSPYPPAPALTDAVWFGTPELWTVLELDGTHGPRKSVWWSQNFTGGVEEPTPDIAVTYRRLDESVPPMVLGSPGTNAHTEDGWFMISGFEPQESGCWEATASYRGSELRYVYLREAG